MEIAVMTKTRELEEDKPVKVSLTYLCPNDPNRAKILEAEGVVMPADGPQHLGGYIVDIRNEEQKKWIVGPDGKNMLVPIVHQTARWLCSAANCGGEIKLDPYRV